MMRAKLFQHAGCQAVRLPKAFSFPAGETEVVVRRQGNRVILEPVGEWSSKFLATLGAWDEGEIERPKPTEPREPFE